MTIIINIKPEVQEELSRQAAAHGVDVNSYAAPCSRMKLSRARVCIGIMTDAGR